MNTRKIFWSYTIILVLLAVLPINGSESTINNTYFISIRLDYLAHFAVYVPWMILLWKLAGTGFRSNPVKALRFILAGLLFASVNEAVQYFLPYRAFNINDLIANGIGVSLGAMIFFMEPAGMIGRSAGKR